MQPLAVGVTLPDPTALASRSAVSRAAPEASMAAKEAAALLLALEKLVIGA